MRQLILAPLIGALLIGIPALLLSSPPSSSAKPLARTVWSVTVRPEDLGAALGEPSFLETLTFEDGRLAVDELARRGFSPAPYTPAMSGYGWSFTAEQRSPTEGRAEWSGDVTDGRLTGTLVWTKSSGSVSRFSLRGEQL
jgi:hypothetical protein